MLRAAFLGIGFRGLCTALPMVLAAGSAFGEQDQAIVATSGISGGLCVQVGCSDTAAAADLARTGRFLVHVLDADPAAVSKTQESLHAQGVYGLASADRLEPLKKLPYTENLVNLVLVEGEGGCAVSAEEIARVLCPHGVVLAREGTVSPSDLRAAGLEDVRAVQAGRYRLLGRKPWPDEADDWSHPRHAADGNPVSRDKLVAPPRRIRWVAGPSQEISNMVTSAGRNFYAGMLARDSFNGLQLWQRTLTPSPARGGYNFQFAPGSVRPVAVGTSVLVVTGGKLVALDGASGRQLCEYTEAGTPSDVLHVDGTLITIDSNSIRALYAERGGLRWKQEAAQPRYVVAGGGAVYFVQGAPQRGEKCTAVRLKLDSGEVGWRRDDYAWLSEVRRLVCDAGQLAFEISTYNDDKPNNRIHVVSAADGNLLFSRTFVPGMTHKKQARAMFVGQTLWVLDDGKCVGLDRHTGEVMKTYPAGSGHCYPPVATERFLFAGEMNLTDLQTGRVDANRITKGACGRDAGFVPANGLIYVFPKHCICWPMLRGYAALAPERSGDHALPEVIDDVEFILEKDVEAPAGEAAPTEDQWPCYRHDAWRSGSTSARVPASLKTLWTADLGGRPEGAIADDWRHNPFLPGPITPPVVAGGKVFVARGDAHQVVALDTETGDRLWTFTANGRIDSAPTIESGLCLFGTKSGWVYGLRADDGRLVWRLRAGPVDERIVAYGQLESPWPVPGSVLVADGVAFFAAGRQPLADGGILVFAVSPTSGEIRWVKRLDSVPQQHFYGRLGLEFDNFDLLHREGGCVAMSRWLFDRATGQMRVEAASGFARLQTGTSGSAMVPRGCWSYAPRHETERVKTRPYLRPPVVFRDNTLLGCLEDKRTLYRRDFDLAGGEEFNTVWSIRSEVGKTGDRSRADRLARAAKWSAQPFKADEKGQTVAAMVLAGDTLLAAGSEGKLLQVSIADGKTLARHDLPTPVWDGMAVTAGGVFVSTRDGRVVCLGGQ